MISKVRHVNNAFVLINYLLRTLGLNEALRSGVIKELQGSILVLLQFLATAKNLACFHIMSGDHLTDSASLIAESSTFFPRYNLCYLCDPEPKDFRYVTIMHRTKNNSIDMHSVVLEEFVSNGRIIPLYSHQADKSYMWQSSIYISQQEGLTVPYMNAPRLLNHTYSDKQSSEYVSEKGNVHNAVLTGFHHGKIETRSDVIAAINEHEYEVIEEGRNHLMVGSSVGKLKMAGPMYQSDFSASQLLHMHEEKRLEILNGGQRYRDFTLNGITRRFDNFQKPSFKYQLNDLIIDIEYRGKSTPKKDPGPIYLNKTYSLWSPRLSDQNITENINKELKHDIPLLSRIRTTTEQAGKTISGIAQLTELVSNFAAAEQAVERERKVEVGRKDIGNETPYEFLSQFSFACTLKEPMQPEAPEGPVNEERSQPSMDMDL